MRPGHSIGESSTPHYIQWKTIEIQALDISATKVRELIRTGGDISSLVPASVANYIRTKGLYGAA
jgi:nicotinic acid mononucleotide adenylyltransferase